MLKRFVTIVIIISSLTACGFHLRGQLNLPPEFNDVAITSSQTYSPLNREIAKQLRANKVNVVDDPSKANMILNITADSITESAETVSTNTALRQYTLHYNVQYRLLSPEGFLIFGPSTTQTSRDYTKQVNQALGADRERAQLEKEMQRDLAYQILNRLSAPSAITAMQKSIKKAKVKS